MMNDEGRLRVARGMDGQNGVESQGFRAEMCRLICAALLACAPPGAAWAQPASPPVTQQMRNANGWAYLNLALKDDARVGLQGGQTLLEWTVLPRADASMSAAKLAREFSENTFRAEAAYQGKTIEVSGKVTRVARGMGGAAYVVFGPFMEGVSSLYSLGMSAYLAFDALHEAASIEPNREVRLFCAEVNTSGFLLSLRGCRIQPELDAAAAKAADAVAARISAGEMARLTEEQRRGLLLIYMAGIGLPAGSVCLRQVVQRCLESGLEAFSRNVVKLSPDRRNKLKSELLWAATALGLAVDDAALAKALEPTSTAAPR